jgi:protein TonB
MMQDKNKKRLSFGFVTSLALHIFVLFGIGFAVPEPSRALKPQQPLEVTLVNSRSLNRPNDASALAQNNLEGGGNVEQNRRMRTPLPSMNNGQQFTPEQSAQRVQQLEQEVKRLMTRMKSDFTVPQEKNIKEKTSDNVSGQDLVTRSLEIARLEAEINRNFDNYQKMPKRKHIGARTQEYRYAQYVEDWRSKVERIGNLNYPQQARDQKIYGKLVLTISIRADGSVESIEINRSSGQRILDAAAQHIVKLAAPYAPFPPDIRKETDILSITRTWMFTNKDQLESE